MCINFSVVLARDEKWESSEKNIKQENATH